MEVPYAPPRKTSIAPLVIGALCVGAGLVLLLGGCASRPPQRTVEQVDLQRYSGKWYEIARYPNWFQRSCAGGVTAEYTPQADGSIRVVNRCFRKDGQPEEVVGQATVVPGSANTKLKVSFGVPFLKGDYWIIGLDRQSYRWALVGHPSRRYLWILAREPRISEEQLGEILKIAISQGYDETRLKRTDQTRNLPRP